MLAPVEIAAKYAAGASLSNGRAAAYRRLLDEVEITLGPMPVQNIPALEAFLTAKSTSGCAANTVRNHLGILRALYRRMYEDGQVSGEIYLAVRAIKPPPESSRRAPPRPYRRKELAALWAILDERWPKLPADEACHWVGRWLGGRSPYRRVRGHAIRCQLDAIIGLALYCGLRRSELFRLEIRCMHPDNVYVVIGEHPIRRGCGPRTVPYIDAGRRLVSPWTRMRTAIAPSHAAAWLNLHTDRTVAEPMRRETFDNLLRTYLGPGWMLSRLRDTCGVAWATAGLSPEHLRQVLGYRSINDALPYMTLVGTDVGRRMEALDNEFQLAIGTTD